MSTNDRELLEMAAKAGYGFSQPAWAAASDGTPVVFELFGKPWNPLEDDGDALRLSVKLNIRIDKHRGGIEAWNYEHRVSSGVIDGDEYAATRRAITITAAEIGRLMS